MEAQTSRKVKYVRANKGWKFMKEEFKQFYLKEGISRLTAVKYTPQQNGLVERMNKLP